MIKNIALGAVNFTSLKKNNLKENTQPKIAQKEIIKDEPDINSKYYGANFISFKGNLSNAPSSVEKDIRGLLKETEQEEYLRKFFNDTFYKKKISSFYKDGGVHPKTRIGEVLSIIGTRIYNIEQYKKANSLTEIQELKLDGRIRDLKQIILEAEVLLLRKECEEFKAQIDRLRENELKT